MLVKVPLEIQQFLEECLIGSAGIFGSDVVGAGFTDLFDEITSGVVFLHHGVDGIRDGLEERALGRGMGSGRLIEGVNERKKNHLFFLHVAGHFIGHGAKGGIDFGEFWAMGAMLCVHFIEKREDTEDRLANIIVMMIFDVGGEDTERCGGPIGFGRINVAAVFLETVKDLFGAYTGMGAGVLEGLPPPAAVVDASVFEDLAGGRIGKGDVFNFGGGGESHTGLHGKDSLGYGSQEGSD